MRLLIDANVVLDVLQKREPYWKDSSVIWKLCETEQAEGYISTLTFANLMYVMRRELDPAQIRDVLDKLRLIFRFADFTAADMEKAAEMGNSYAMGAMGYLYKEGEGVEQNMEKAIAYYQQAVDLGNPYAMSDLAAMYAEGNGVEQDLEKAAEYYRKAVELGDESAAEKLKSLTEEGKAPAEKK